MKGQLVSQLTRPAGDVSSPRLNPVVVVVAAAAAAAQNEMQGIAGWRRDQGPCAVTDGGPRREQHGGLTRGANRNCAKREPSVRRQLRVRGHLQARKKPDADGCLLAIQRPSSANYHH
ncbi:hypothetical protein C0Q70_13287 [Pomacea canaliculata]|uniref:Uncharacterized protein n=1 Tax=Pomacea canaliculata TaxID=400727 RepID=A0A2T7NWT4_POMCA|nr:hypothetical protein C0Q70_13287 [Pomacea canaliculata]